MHIGGPFPDKSRRHARKKWYLTYFVPRLHHDGTPVLTEDHRPVLERKRPYYASKVDAQEDKPRIVAQYATAGAGRGGVITRAMAEEFQQAKQIAPEVSAVDLAKFWRLHHPTTAVETIGNLVPRCLAHIAKRVGTGAHYQDLKSRLSIFGRTFGERLPETVTRKEIMAWLFSYPKSGRTVLNLKQCVCSFFNWLREEGLIEVNPAGGIKRKHLPQIVVSEIRFLSADQVVAYLRAAERYDAELVAHEIVQLFAGVRADDEMADFDGSWVLPQTREIVIPAEVAKTKKREVIACIEDNFWSWWKVYGRGGVLRPTNYLRRWQRLRVLAVCGDQYQADILASQPIKALLKSPEAKAAIPGWPWNARRRTFATHHVAKHQSAALTALIMRHRGNTYTLHNSYRGTGVTPSQGAAFFNIAPAPVQSIGS